MPDRPLAAPNPATYIGVFTDIRDLFAKLPEAKIRGYKPGRFSFNVTGGRCEACAGDGMIKIEMHFLPDIYVPCEVCKGRRYNREALEVKFRGKSIADVLEMTVEKRRRSSSTSPGSCARCARCRMSAWGTSGSVSRRRSSWGRGAARQAQHRAVAT